MANPRKLRLPAFARPFVTRSLRGPRQRRYVALSGILALVALFIGSWIALGSGAFEQQARVSLGLERPAHERELNDFTIYARDGRELDELERAHARRADFVAIPGQWAGDVSATGEYLEYDWAYYRLSDAEYAAWLRLEHVAATESLARDDAQRELSRRARALLESRGWADPYAGHADDWASSPSPYFDWSDPQQVAAVERILAQDLHAAVAMYRSPLDLRDAISLVGMIAGGLLSILLLVVAPVSAGIQQAQEVHENTLMPLRTTSLSARELALGLASGPLAVAGIIAAPQLGLLLVCGAAVGSVGYLMVEVAVLLVTSLALTLMAQLAGQVMGRHRTPGMVGIALLSLAALAWFAGLGLSLGIDRDTAGSLALAPHGAALFALGATFVDTPSHGPVVQQVGLASTLIGAVGLGVIGLLTFSALEHRVAEREGQVLSLGQGLVGVVACIAMILTAVAGTLGVRVIDDEPEALYLVSMALMAPVLGIFVASQVPVGGVPQTRRVPVPRILGALGIAIAIHLGAVAAAVGFDAELLQAFHPVGAFHLSWSLLVLGLLAIRVVSYPVQLTDGLLVMLVCGAGIAAFGHSVYWAADRPHGLGIWEIFAFGHLSPVLGLAQIAWMIAIPTLLVRGLRRHLGSISPAHGSSDEAPASAP